MTRSRDVADTQDNSGGAVAPVVAGKNVVINGAFDIWQRGTSLTPTTGANYTADRWVSLRAVTGYTISRQTTSDTTNLPFIQYCARVQRTSGNTATDIIYFNSSIETANTIPYAGRTITMSFYARAGANFSASGNLLSAELYTGTGTDQQVNVGYTGVAAPISTSMVLTTTWQRFSASVTLNGNVTEFAPYFRYTPTGTAGANDYFEITGVQLEIGSVATPFSRAGGTLQGELAACTRYFKRNYINDGVSGFCDSTTKALYAYSYPDMRVAPTLSVTAGDFRVRYSGASVATATAFTLDSATTTNARFDVTVASGLTAGQGVIMNGNGSNKYFDLSSEL